MVTKRADQVGDPIAMLDKIETAIRSMYTRIANLRSQIDEVERLGWVEAKPYYRNNKYLYLIYPMHDGERKREYIGCDPEDIEKALAKIKRKEEFDQLHQQLSNVEFALNKTRQLLIEALSAAYSVKW